MATKMFLVRHGNTNWNNQHRFAGRNDRSRLTERGREEAKLLAKGLGKDRIDAVYSSPLTRARETASIIKPDGMGIVMKEELMERDMGGVEGKTRQEIEKAIPNIYKKHRVANDFPGFGGVEPFSQLQQRGLKALTEIAEKEKGKTILVVSHGALIRSVLSSITGIDSRDERLVHKNCGLTILKYEGRGDFSVEMLNNGNLKMRKR